MAKATHYGTCQICEAQHKMTSSGLAQHGYTVEYGFFNGVCSGSKHLPYEQDRSLIPHSILYLKERCDAYEKENKALKHTPLVDGKVWMHMYYSTTGYIWELVELTGGPTLWQVKQTSDKGRSSTTGWYHGSMDEIAHQEATHKITHNKNCIKRILRHIDSLQHRYDNWKQLPLTPIQNTISQNQVRKLKYEHDPRIGSYTKERMAKFKPLADRIYKILDQQDREGNISATELEKIAR